MDKKPRPLCPVISFRCLAPSSIMATFLISAPLQSKFLLHRQGGVRVSGTENKVKSSPKEPLHAIHHCGDLIPFSPVAQARRHLLRTVSHPWHFSKVCYIQPTCSYGPCACIVLRVCLLRIIQSTPFVLSGQYHQILKVAPSLSLSIRLSIAV